MNPFMTNSLPWSCEFDLDENRWFVIDADGNDVATLTNNADGETAEFIIRAVNGGR